ncbi:MAG: sugar phosphate isomerase/epimerase [Litorilinea sp.]
MFKNLGIGELGHRASLTESIGLAARHGFEGITFSIVDASELAASHSADYVAQLFAEAGVQPGAWHFPVQFRQDEAQWREDMDKLPGYAALAQQLECRRTFTYIVPADNERTFTENFHFHVDRLRPAAQILNDYGCRLGLEFVGPYTSRQNKRYSFVHTLEGARALAAALGTRNAGILLDIWHLHTAHGRNQDILELKGDEIVYVHVNDAPTGVATDALIDNVRTLPGETGVLEIGGFLDALGEIGYDGPVTAEPFSQRVRDLGVDEAVAATAAAFNVIWPT